MKIKKKILIFTGSRADYGILRTLIKKLNIKINISIVAGADHYSKKFGLTYKEILNDGYNINYRSKLKSYDNSQSLSIYCSKILEEYSNIILKKKFNGAIVLGDRYEAYIFSLSCFLNKVPIFHLHGGELTKGSIDDSMRHSISKFANFHFVTRNIYKRRLIQLGEVPEKIFMYGSLGNENFNLIKNSSKKKIFSKYKIPFEKKLIIVTFHPETISNFSYKKQIDIFLGGLKNKKNYFYIFTSTNSDPGSKLFMRQINSYVNKNKNSKIVNSFGQEDYAALLKKADLMVGNSSSGVIESPSASIYSIIVGNRQDGRFLDKNIIKCSLNSSSISTLIDKYIKKKINIKNGHQKSSSLISKKICQIIKKDKINLIKKFYDIG